MDIRLVRPLLSNTFRPLWDADLDAPIAFSQNMHKSGAHPSPATRRITTATLATSDDKHTHLYKSALVAAVASVKWLTTRAVTQVVAACGETSMSYRNFSFLYHPNPTCLMEVCSFHAMHTQLTYCHVI